ncbi:MAG TPA: hypothetical protein VHI51_14800 [Ktedonobacterales bacterium]|nr:hypothetical protein [Ktedonobacterales bacterium]
MRGIAPLPAGRRQGALAPPVILGRLPPPPQRSYADPASATPAALGVN